MKRRLRWVILVVILAPFCVVFTCNALRDHDSVFTKEGLLVANADRLAATDVTAHLDVPIPGGKNVLWCGTFQLAWNEACTLVGEPLRFARPMPMVDALNKQSFQKTDLDKSSYVALAGHVRDGIRDRIPRALNEEFGGRATPRLLPSVFDALRPQDIVAYAYLFKNLEFPRPFERFKEPLDFSGRKVACFGMEGFRRETIRMYPQVIILDYKDQTDFVIELKTKSRQDQLVLAKITPSQTLSATIEEVRGRIAESEGQQASPGDILVVPKLAFDITRKYGELIGAALVTQNPQIAKDLVIVAAVQNTRFQIDEKGARLMSESRVSGGCAHRPAQHVMIFDKPFLILLQQTGAKSPYFALWVDNGEVLAGSK